MIGHHRFFIKFEFDLVVVEVANSLEKEEDIQMTFDTPSKKCQWNDACPRSSNLECRQPGQIQIL